MKNVPLSELSNDDLLAKRKKIKSLQKTTAMMVGVLAGVAIYQVVKHGLGFFTFFPLFFIFLILRNKNQLKEFDQELATRGLQH